MSVLSLITTLLVAALGATVFVKLKVPAGAFLGAMIFVVTFNVLTDFATFPVNASPYVRIFAGALIGSRMTKSDVIELKTILFPAVLLVFGMLVLNLSLGYGIHRLTGLELSTALLGSAPGGVQDMALIADDLGANAAQIALLQTVRILAILGILPTLLTAFCKRYLRNSPDSGTGTAEKRKTEPAEGNPAALPAANADVTGDTKEVTKEDSTGRKKDRFEGWHRKDVLAFARTMVFAAIGGLLLNMTDLPAGAMVGAMLLTVLSTILIRPAYVPPGVRTVVMTCAGALIGSGVGADDLIRLGEIIVPAAILVVVLLIANFVFGILIHKITKLDLITSLFASAAGGMTDMALISDTLGADAPKVAILQLLRLICVITMFPTVLRFFMTLV